MALERWMGRRAAGAALLLALTVLAAGWNGRTATAAGTVTWGWGSNVSGQLGDRTRSDISRPSQLTTAPAASSFTTIAAGQYHSLAVDTAGSVWAWGDNVSGQLGQQALTSSAFPLQVMGFPAGTVVTAVAAGGYHSLALDSSGAVWAWGWNGAGQLGDGTTEQRNAPVPVAGFPAGTVIQAIAAGYSHSLALDSTGAVWSWGLNDSGQLGVAATGDGSTPLAVAGFPDGTRITAIAAGGYHSLALDAVGQAWSWGSDLFGQLGDGGSAGRSVPVPVSGLPTGTVLTAVAAGYDHSLALDATGQIWSWGNNRRGQLGNGQLLSSSLPQQVQGLPAGSTITAIAAGGYHNLALDENGSVWAWGDDESEQLGATGRLVSTAPLQVGGLPAGTRITVIAAGGYHSLALGPQ